MQIAWCYVILTLLSADNSPGQWPGWRGLEAQGVGSSSAPLQWSSDTNIKWHTPLPGSGHSSPVVAGNQVFVTAAVQVSGASAGRAIAIKGLLMIGAALVLGLTVRGSLRGDGIRALSMRSLLAGVCLGGLLQIRAIEPHTSGQGAQYFLWLQLFTVTGTVLLTLAGVPRGRRRLLPGTLLVAGAVVMIWLRPNAAYYQLTMDNMHSWPTLLAFLTLLLPGISLLASSLWTRTSTTESVPRPVVRRLTISLAVVIVGTILTMDALIASSRLRQPGRLYFLESVPLWPYFAVALLWSISAFSSPQKSRVRDVFLPGALFLLVGAMSILAYCRPKDVLTRSILCIDRSNGSVQWVCTGLKSPRENTHSENSPATPTPVVLRDKVYAWFGTAGLICCDLAGKLQWVNTDLPFKDIHGVAASPVIADGKLIIVSGNPKGPYITALDTETGKRAWRTELRPWTGIHGEHSTPAVVSVAGKTAILNWTLDYDDLAAYDATDGRELWRWPVPIRRTGEAVASIVVERDRLYLSDKTTMLCARVASAPTVLWKAPMRGKGANTASPVLHKGLLFTVADAGWASCLDATTGELYWQERVAQECLSSPIAAGDRVYFPTKMGTTVVVACDRQFRRLADNSLPGNLYASPAPVDGQLIFRTTKELWCIEQ